MPGHPDAVHRKPFIISSPETALGWPGCHGTVRADNSRSRQTPVLKLEGLPLVVNHHTYPVVAMSDIRSSRVFCALAGVAALMSTATVYAAQYHYTDWTSANPSAGTASGVITLPDLSTVTVDFQAVNPDSSPGSFSFAQTSGGGNNYWNPSSPYISSQVENAPPGTDIVALIGGANQTYKVTLSAPIKDPIMSIVSLGRGGSNTKYDFDSPFTIVSQGAGYWGGGASALTQLPGDVLNGNEGHGTIQFIGTFSTFSWTVPTPENWHGFTFGIRTTEALEPTPNTVPDTASTLGLTALSLTLLGAGHRFLKQSRR